MDMYDVKRSFNKSENYIPFVKHLLELSEKSDCYSEKDIMDETTTIASAGYETSACTNTLALILLGTYQNVQEKAYQEIRDVFGDSDRDVTKEDLRQLVYLDAVFKEITRLYPIGPLIARYMVKDVRLKNYTLKAGNGIGILIWALHRHPMWGPDADLFRPERWLDGSAPSNTHAYGAFSLGKRSCIGKTYATMSIKTGLVHILRSYKIYSDMSKVELEIDATLRVASGQSIRIEKRNPIG